MSSLEWVDILVQLTRPEAITSFLDAEPAWTGRTISARPAARGAFPATNHECRRALRQGQQRGLPVRWSPLRGFRGAPRPHCRLV